MSKNKALEKLSTHAHYGKLYFKLAEKDRAEIVAFALINFDLSKDDFEFKVNRLYLDVEAKPKNYTKIMELLSAFNTMRFL
jgi:hypothetical protein